MRLIAIWGSVVCAWSHLAAQETSPRWSVAAGPGIVFRSARTGSFGVNLRFGRMIQPTSSVFLEPSLTWHGYGRSAQGGDLCPIEGCPPPRRDEISLIGVEMSGGYRKARSENPIYPVAGVGLYRVSAQDTAGTRLGASAGIVIPFRRSNLGPGIVVRYFRLFGDSRFRSLIPISLRWAF